MLFLILPYLPAHSHSLGKKVHQLVVKLINLLTQSLYSFCGDSIITHDEKRQNIIKHIRCNLLLSIAPGIVRLAVAFHYQSLKAKIHCLLAQRSYKFTSSANVAWVADNWQIWNPSVQFNWYLPHWKIAIYLFVITRESSVNGCHALYTGPVYSLHCSYP